MNNPPKDDDIGVRETELFGAPVEKLSYGCREVYQVLRIEDLEYIATHLNFNWGSLNIIENIDQFEKIRPILEQLSLFRAEREAIPTNDIPGRRGITEKYKPIEKKLSSMIDSISE
jgi:hypothetical protein